MHVFKDNAGRTWTISISVSAVKRVRALLNLDLYSLIDDRFEGLSKLVADPVTLIDLIFVLCHDDAGKLGITDEDFGRAMAGDSIMHATDAFLAEFVDFFPDPRVRDGLKKVIDAGNRVKDLMLKQASDQLNEIDLESEARKLIASSGGSPESSASTPARLRSVS